MLLRGRRSYNYALFHAASPWWMWITIIILLLLGVLMRNILMVLISPRIQFLKKLPNMMTHVHTYKIQNLIIKISFIFKNWTSSQMKCTIASFLVNLVSQFDRFDRLCAHLTNFEKFSFSPFHVVTLLKSLNLWNCFHKHLKIYMCQQINPVLWQIWLPFVNSIWAKSRPISRIASSK